MNQQSAFERRLAAGLEQYAGPPRSVDAIAVARTAASPLPLRHSIAVRFSSGVVPARRLVWRLIALVAASAILALALAAGAVFVGGQQHPLPAVVAPAANGLIAYSSDGDILVGDAVTGQTTAIVTGPGVDSQPHFSPDGSRIAFVRGEWLTADASIVVVRADGSDERVIVPIRFPGRGLGAFSWTPDSASILVNHDVGIGPSGGLVSMFDASGAAAPRLVTPPLPAWPGGGHPQTRGGVAPMFRPPTGDRILSYEWDTSTLSVMDPDGTDVRSSSVRPGLTRRFVSSSHLRGRRKGRLSSLPPLMKHMRAFAGRTGGSSS